MAKKMMKPMMAKKMAGKKGAAKNDKMPKKGAMKRLSGMEM
jgi:hypothetical protein